MNAPRDANRVPTLLGVSSLDLLTPTTIAVNPTTGAMLIDSPSLWIVDEDQIDITGDKTGSFDLTTTGTGTFSQVLTPEIKTDTTTPTDLTVTTGAAKTLVLATSVFDDLQFQVSNAKVTPNNLLPSWEAFTTNTSEYAFSVNDEVDTQANEIPHWWKEGTAGNAHLHITTKGVPAQEQKAQFTVTFAYADTNEVWVEAPLTAELTIPISTTALTNFYLDLGNLTLTNYLIGAQIRCRIKRVAKSAGGTEYVGDIFITQCGIHLEKTRMGSRNEIIS